MNYVVIITSLVSKSQKHARSKDSEKTKNRWQRRRVRATCSEYGNNDTHTKMKRSRVVKEKYAQTARGVCRRRACVVWAAGRYIPPQADQHAEAHRQERRRSPKITRLLYTKIKENVCLDEGHEAVPDGCTRRANVVVYSLYFECR